jgi:hypothetical protein
MSWHVLLSVRTSGGRIYSRLVPSSIPSQSLARAGHADYETLVYAPDDAPQTIILKRDMDITPLSWTKCARSALS